MTSGNDQPPRVDTAALLASVDIVEVIGRHITLKKAGAEFEACCPFHTENTPSFKVSPAKQIYHCFGCGANGDAIAFLQNHAGLTFRQAAKELGADVSDVSRPSASPAEPGPSDSKPRRAATPWRPIVPAPPECPEPPRAHQVRGLPERTWCYRDGAGRRLGYVYRFATSGGGKEVLPLTWCARDDTGQASWRWISFPKPRPLYGLDRLASRPEATVMLVEGEPCADVGAEALPELVVITWPGGGKAVDTVDWSPLAERKVVLWPDCDAKRVPLTRAERQALPSEEAQAQAQAARPLLDEQKQPGIQAMTRAAEHLRALGAKLWMVRLPPPGQVTDGWDIADAVREGMTGDALRDWLRDRLQPIAADDSAAAPSEGADDDTGDDHGPAVAVEGEEPQAWRRGLIYKDGRLVDCRENVYLILRQHPAWKGVLWADDFSRKIIKRKPAPWEERSGFTQAVWAADDDLRLGLWLAQRLRLVVQSARTLQDAVGWVARESKFHPVIDYLESLEWDGTRRLDHWTVDFLGMRPSPYAALSGRLALIGMASRIFRPGGILRSMPILEGPQYRGKSTALRVLGEPWFSDTSLDLGNKDAYQAIQGIWVYEIPEMDTFNRTESSRMKGFISSPSDRFRAPYGREPEDWPRQTCFFGTINPDGEYFKDRTGNTRYWPWACEQAEPMNIDGLARNRDQLLAEAVAEYKRGARWYPTPEEQRALFEPEQESRTIEDAWDVIIDRYLRTITAPRVTVTDILIDCLKIERGKITRQHSTQVGQAMAKTHWVKSRESTGARERYYERPKGWGESPAAKAGDGGRNGGGSGAV